MLLVITLVLRHPLARKLLLELIGDEALVVLHALLDVHLELDDIVEHACDLCVELLPQGISSDGELFVPVYQVSKVVTTESPILRRCNLLNIDIHLPLLHQLHALRQVGSHLGELLLHLLNLGVRSHALCVGDLLGLLVLLLGGAHPVLQ